MRHVGPIRRELGIPTVMNFLGPLCNPAGVQSQLVGVSDPSMAEKMIEVLRVLGKARAMVVFGHDGLDEITTMTTSTVFELRDGIVRSFVVDPAELGIARPGPGELKGGDVVRNSEIARSVLEGRRGPPMDIVALNSAAALVVADLVPDIEAGVEMAMAAILEGRAAEALEAMVTASQAEAE
jgi:anthranilate phosphoribosyltransferase